MTLGAWDLALYVGALVILFCTPGPVWVALIARTLSGGVPAAWPLAVGVAIGDIFWPFIAILGVTWILSVFADLMFVLRILASIMFLVMGVLLIKNAGTAINQDGRLTRPGKWAGFVAGLAVILGNPKAVLFYIGVLPGFFDLTKVTAWDIVVICTLSFLVPLIGNLGLAFFVDRARQFLSSGKALQRANIGAGIMLIGVGVVIALS